MERLRVMRWRCKQGHFFDAPTLSDFDYGPLLAYGASQSVEYIDTFADPVWDEAVSLVEKSFPAFRSRSGSVQSEIVQAAFSATLDPGPAGPLAIGRSPCPVCGADGSVHQDYEPARWRDVSHATHTVWASLDADAKGHVVSEALRRFVR